MIYDQPKKEEKKVKSKVTDIFQYLIFSDDPFEDLLRNPVYLMKINKRRSNEKTA